MMMRVSPSYRKQRLRRLVTVRQRRWRENARNLFLFLALTVTIWYQWKLSLEADTVIHQFPWLPLPPQPLFRLNPERSPPWAIFYNIFIPKDEGQAAVENVLRIVEEQLESIRKSYAASIPDKPVTVFYNTIGNGEALRPEFMKRVCTKVAKDKNKRYLKPAIDCRHMGHYDSAFEEVTLQRLYDFCQIHQNYRVAYVHSKGSYHDHKDKRNEYWRRHGTLAATSELCLKPANDTCNLCGMQFWSYWTFFMPGNFWSAQCSYIQQLVPPLQFEERMNHVTMKALLMKLQNKFTVNMYEGRNDHYGVERFASEHWVGSHPSVIPCDVGGHQDFWYWLSGDRGWKQFAWDMGPRKRGSPVGEELIGAREERVLANKTLRTKEYFLLAGRLFKWFELYSEAPPSNSWIWDWFPDGDRWKQAVHNFGNKTVEVVTSGLATLPDTPRSLQYTTSDDKTILTVDTARSPHWTIFHDIVAPRNSTESVMVVVEQDLDQISNSYAASVSYKPVTVFFNTIGDRTKANPTKISELCSKRKGIICHHMHHFEEGVEGMALQSVFDFCQTHGSFRVVYLHTREPRRQSDESASFLHTRHSATKAALSEMCLKPEEGSCNVCGAQFSFFPINAMAANIWTAQCSYVKKLIAPIDFQEKMADVTMKALLKRLQGKFTTSLLTDGVDHFGVDQYALDHWVCSHPSINPCDSANGMFLLASNNTQDESSFALSIAPLDGSNLKGWDVSKAKKMLLDEDRRAREYFLLAGKLFKWYTLYGEVPSSSSWVWKRFPDGSKWLDATKKFGNQSIDVITSKSSLLSDSSTDAEMTTSRRSKELTFDSKSSPNWVVFYHIYMPFEEEGAERALAIIAEQLGQVGTSHAASVIGKPVTVFYTAVGNVNALNSTLVPSICSRYNMICELLESRKNAFEGVTLQHLHDFCQSHESLRVAYIHSKGSFHNWPGGENTRWRKHSTMAVTSEMCLSPPDDSCNICGLQFYPLWNVFFPGNFWAGKCSYIKKLVAPSVYFNKLSKMALELQRYEEQKIILANNLYDHGLPFLNAGPDRYAWEIWSGTHPSINPCDVSPTADHDYWRLYDRSMDDMVWGMGPRHGMSGPWLMLDKERRKRVMTDKSLRFRDYFLLPGNLIKWHSLYGEAPPSDSWIWSWFPDGPMWRRAVGWYGSKAVEKNVERLVTKKSWLDYFAFI